MLYMDQVTKSMNGYTCSLFLGKTQEECTKLERKSKDFFTDKSFRKRALRPQTYFQQLQTVALKPVWIIESISL